MCSLQSSNSRWWLSATAVAAVALLAACGRPAETAVAKPLVDAAMARAAVAGSAKDKLITTDVSTLLTRDNQLSTLKIDVDTRSGQVVLQGDAPNEAARSRAADLARSVGGVMGVENKLQVVRN